MASILDFTEISQLLDEDVIYVGRSEDSADPDKRISGAALISSLFAGAVSAARPIGDYYIQLPGKKSPDQLNYPGTWSIISSEFAGDFLRVEGGRASAFESGRQGFMLQGHFHEVTTNTASGTTGTRNYVYDSGVGNAAESIASAGANTIVSDGANGDPVIGAETRPVNRTIRLWERTA